MDPHQRAELIRHAVVARQAAYAPYSNYQVGASVLAKSGLLYAGCNVENASYGLCFCAERTAIVKAVSEGELEFEAIAIATKDGGTPCGACRQVMAEFCNDDLLVITHCVQEDTSQDHTLGQLFPDAFRLQD